MRGEKNVTDKFVSDNGLSCLSGLVNPDMKLPRVISINNIAYDLEEECINEELTQEYNKINWLAIAKKIYEWRLHEETIPN